MADSRPRSRLRPLFRRDRPASCPAPDRLRIGRSRRADHADRVRPARPPAARPAAVADQLGQPGQPAPAGDPVRRAARARAEQRRRPARRAASAAPTGSQHSSSAAPSRSRNSRAARGVPAAREPTAAAAGRSGGSRPAGASPCRAARRPRAAPEPGVRGPHRVRSSAVGSQLAASPRTPARRPARAPARRRPPHREPAGAAHPDHLARPGQQPGQPGRRRRRPRPTTGAVAAHPRRPRPAPASRPRQVASASARRASTPEQRRLAGRERAGALVRVTARQRHSGTSSKACFSSSESSLLVSSALGVVLLVERVARAARTAVVEARSARRCRRPSMESPALAVRVADLRPASAVNPLAIGRRRSSTSGTPGRLRPCAGRSRWPAPRPPKQPDQVLLGLRRRGLRRSSAAGCCVVSVADLGPPRGERRADRRPPTAVGCGAAAAARQRTTIVAQDHRELSGGDARGVRMRCSVRADRQVSAPGRRRRRSPVDGVRVDRGPPGPSLGQALTVSGRWSVLPRRRRRRRPSRRHRDRLALADHHRADDDQRRDDRDARSAAPVFCVVADAAGHHGRRDQQRRPGSSP